MIAVHRLRVSIMQADEMGCDVMTITNDILKKLGQVGKRLDEVSLEKRCRCSATTR